MEKQTKHTTLDWKKVEVSNYNNGEILKIGLFPKESSICVHPIARIEINERYCLDEAKANAELICKAVNSYPKLVEALKSTRKLNLHLYDEGTIGNDICKEIETLLKSLK